MKIFALIGAVVILLSTPFLTLAQDGEALGKQIEICLKARSHKRELKEAIHVGNHWEQKWSSEGKNVLVLIYELGSPEEASETYERHSIVSLTPTLKNQSLALEMKLIWCQILEASMHRSVFDEAEGI
jgi:hypothetical protein